MVKSRSPEKYEPEIIDKIPEELRKKLDPELLAAISISVRESWSAPYPPPKIFKQYPPDVRKAIIRQSDSQLKHRQQIEKKVITSNIANSGRGMTYAFWLTMGLMTSGVILLLAGVSTAGLVALFGGSGFQVVNFLFKKWQEHSEISKNAGEENNRQVRRKPPSD